MECCIGISGELGGYFGGYSAAGGEVGGYGHFFGGAGADQVVEDFVGEGFVEDSLVAVGLEVEFECFQLEAELAGVVGDGDGAEVWLAGLGAEAGEFGADNLDFVVAVGGGIGESFQLIVFGHHLFVLLIKVITSIKRYFTAKSNENQGNQGQNR